MANPFDPYTIKSGRHTFGCNIGTEMRDSGFAVVEYPMFARVCDNRDAARYSLEPPADPPAIRVH